MKLSDGNPSIGGCEDNSTQNSNNLDCVKNQSDKPQVSHLAMFVANMPRWFIHY